MSQAGILSITDQDIPGNVPTEFVGNSGSGSPINHIFDIIGVGGVSTSVIDNVMTITVSTSGFTWNTVTSITPANPVQIVAENGYICAGSSMVTLLLPLTANIGDTFKVFSYTSLFQIIPNGSQQMVVGAVTGIIGSTGTVTSNSPGDMITFTYMGGNIFQSEAPQGTMTVVIS